MMRGTRVKLLLISWRSRHWSDICLRRGSEGGWSQVGKSITSLGWMALFTAKLTIAFVGVRFGLRGRVGCVRAIAIWMIGIVGVRLAWAGRVIILIRWICCWISSSRKGGAARNLEKLSFANCKFSYNSSKETKVLLAFIASARPWYSCLRPLRTLSVRSSIL